MTTAVCMMQPVLLLAAFRAEYVTPKKTCVQAPRECLTRRRCVAEPDSNDRNTIVSVLLGGSLSVLTYFTEKP